MKNKFKIQILAGVAIVSLMPLIRDSYADPENKTAKVVLSSSIAGSWYPADANLLKGQVEGLFRQAKAEPANDVIAMILPHAGYQYSGRTAASALKTTDKKYKRIIVIGPSHRVPMRDVFSVPAATHYKTPLGEIPIDVEFINKLLKYPLFRNVPQTDEYEHSVQIEIPLLQYRWKDFAVVPIVAGDCSQQTIKQAADILKGLVDGETLIIASSDFTHYGPNYDYVPFRENVPEQIKKLDMGAYEFIKALDYKGFLGYRQKTGATICGFVPIAVLLAALPASAQAHLAGYTTSGEITGDFTNSVSYFAVAFSGAWQDGPKIEPQAAGSELTGEDKKQLLALARKSIIYFLQKGAVPQESDLNVTVTPAMRSVRAAFVTLKKKSQLRGCIGEIFPRQPLYKSVISNAVNAGFNDTRFYPLKKEECNDITIEISALTVPKSIASYDQIRIGTDGVVLSKDGYSAVFLPQVAPEQGWNVSQMLSELSLKAGLPEDTWKKGAEFMVFQADVFGEKEK